MHVELLGCTRRGVMSVLSSRALAAVDFWGLREAGLVALVGRVTEIS